jgi:hypothetical protein
VSLFYRDRIVGTFLGFSEGGLEFHAELVLPYRSDFQSTAMHGQFVLVALENDNEAVLGRITTIAAQGRLVTPSGEDYAIRAVREERAIPENLRDQYLKYRVDIRILGVLRLPGGDKPPVFVASHRRLPHVGAKVAFLSDELLCQVAGATIEGKGTAELGFLALGEFVYVGDDRRAGDLEWLQPRSPAVIPRFEIKQLVSRRTFVFARAGFGKSNLVKLLFAKLYGGDEVQTVEKRGKRTVNVGTVIFDPDSEYFWPDDKGRPGLCDVEELRDRLVVFTDRESRSAFYQSYVVDKVRLDIRELPPAKVIGLVIPPERQEHQNVAKLKSLGPRRWNQLVDAVWQDKGGTDLHVFYEALQLKRDGSQDAEALAARSNMVRVVNALHHPSSQLLPALKKALSEGKLCVVDISRMRGAQGLSLAGVILQHIFEHNQEEFTKADSRTIPTIAVIEEAQSVLGASVSAAEGPFVAWVKEGRKYDLGAVLITQQPGSLPNELLSQGDNWFIFHLLSAGDLRALKNANAHFSDDLLSSLLNEPLVGHGIFWSSAGATPYPIPIRALSFEDTYKTLDPDDEAEPIDNYAARLRHHLQEALVTAAQAAGGAATVGDTVDVSETNKNAAINILLRDQSFQTDIRSPKGIPWGRVQELLAQALPDTLGTLDDRKQWVYEQQLVPAALDSVVGRGVWTTESRPRRDDPTRFVKWILVSATPDQESTDLP